MDLRLTLSTFLLAFFLTAPAQSQQPSSADSLESTAADSMRAAFGRFNAKRSPTSADSTALRRWADALQTTGDSVANADPKRARNQLRAARRAYRALADSVGVANVIDVLGRAYEKQGRYEEALARHREALEIHREAGSRHGIAEALKNIGVVYNSQSRYEEALARSREALDIFRDLGDREGIARALNVGGIAHWYQGRYEEALARYREALENFRKIGGRKDIANALNNTGLVHRMQGRYEEALARYREALKIYNEIGDRNHIATSLMNIGVVYYSQGRYEEALARSREALDIRREIGDRAGVANLLNNIGVLHSEQGRYQEALSRHRASLNIKREIGDRAGIATSLSSIGGVHWRQGRYEEALTRYRESLSLERELEDPEGIALKLYNVGRVYEDQNRYERALAHYRQALPIFQEIGARRRVSMALKNLGSTHLGAGWPQAATDTLRRAIRQAEQLRLNTTSPEARRSLLSTQIGSYRALSAAHLRSGHPDSALRSIEQARARLLADRLADTATGDTSFALPSISKLRQTLGPEEAALLYAGADSEWALTALVVTRGQVVARELPDSTVRAAIGNDYPARLNRLRREEGPLTAAMNRGASSGESTTPSLAEIIRLYRYYLTREQAASSIQTDLSRRLHSLLVEPITDALADKGELLAVPTGALGYLPLETLQDASGTYLAERRHVRYAQSLTVLRQLQQRDYSGRERPLLALGGAAYAPEAPIGTDALIAEARRGSTRVATDEHAATLLRSAERKLEQGRSPKQTYTQLGYGQWSDLPGTREEVDALQALAGPDATILTGPGASESAVREEQDAGRLADYRYVHFATHGVAVPETPKLSALVLSQVGTSDSLAARDGYLTMEEIAGLEMKADVAVLSACQTGLGKVVAGEGVVSLSHAFLRAGANATLVSQWKVLDESTRQFMTTVYKKAKAEDTSFAEAVTKTKRTFINGEYGEKNIDPLRWAPFVYYGRE